MSIVNKLIDRIYDYVRLKGEQIKLEAIGQISKLLAQFIAIMTIGLIALFLFVFLSLALSAYLNTVLDSPFYGYLIVSGIFLIVMIIVLILLRTRKLQHWFEAIFVDLSEEITVENDDQTIE